MEVTRYILLVEDHALVREGLVHTLRRIGTEWEVVEAYDSASAMERLDDVDFELVVLDLLLPGMNGMAFLSLLRRRYPTLPVIVVSAMFDRVTVDRAMRQGASGFVPKTSSGETLIDAVEAVLAGEIYLPSEKPVRPGRFGRIATSKKTDAKNHYNLTDAQERVLSMLALGKNNREIGEALGLTEGTVKVHVSRIYRSLGVNSRAQALLVLARDGITFD